MEADDVEETGSRSADGSPIPIVTESPQDDEVVEIATEGGGPVVEVLEDEGRRSSGSDFASPTGPSSVVCRHSVLLLYSFLQMTSFHGEKPVESLLQLVNRC